MGFQSRSPVKEGSFLQRETSAEESDTAKEGTKDKDAEDLSVSPPPAREGVPIRR